MGSGKTAVGKHLARLLHLSFYDSDVEIERRTGVDIPYIFEKEGESRLSRARARGHRRLTQLDNVVIATGGGAVLLPENRERLASAGRVVYLRPASSSSWSARATAGSARCSTPTIRKRSCAS